MKEEDTKMKKAHIAYFAAGLGGGVENRYEDLRQAFNLAKEIASENKFGTALLRKVEWDSNGRIIKHEGCKVFADGKWEYLYR